MSKTEFLFLSEDDLVKAGVLNASECIDTCEDVFGILSDGDYLMGGLNHNEHGLSIVFPKETQFPGMPVAGPERRFIAMPAYLGGRFHVAGEKWYGSNGNNRKKGLPRSILMVMLNDVETGKPLAYMSGNLLSSMRTGAMPGMAAKLLAKKDAKTLTLLGCGVVNKSCLMSIMTVRPEIEVIKIKGSSPTSQTAINMKKYIEKSYPRVKEVIICATMEEAIKDADIVSEAISCMDGQWPEVKREWMKPGLLYISSSTFNMEYNSIVDLKKVIDNYGMYENYAEEDDLGYDDKGNRLHTGCMGEDFVYMVEDGLIERDSITQIGQIIRGKRPGRESDDEIILVSMEGMPIEDVAWAYECYTYALVHDIGTRLKVWDKPRAF